MANLAEHLFHQATARADKVALRFDGRCFTFGEMAERVLQCGGALASIGVGVGSRVGVMMASRPEFIFFQQATFALGAAFSPLNIFYRSSELLHSIRSCALDYLLIDAEFLDRLPQGDPVLQGLKAIVAVGHPAAPPGQGILSAQVLTATARPIAAPIEVPAEALGMMLNTSATTGKSKGVMLSIANIKANYDRTPAWLGLSDATVTLCALPLYNTFGLNQCINALMVTGGSLVLLPRFDALTCIEMIEQHRCTFLPAVPTMLQKIFDHPEAARRDLSSIGRIMTGGAPVPAALLERIHSAVGMHTIVLTGYGLTEATALVTLDRIERGSDGRILRPKSIGKVLEGMEMRIFAQDDRAVSPGEVGEICLRGPNVMSGYFRMPEDTACALAGGWLHTGDLGYIDADGYAYIVDRKKDVIIRGGQNIYPADIEEAIYRIPGVREVAVVRRQDALLGEVPVAFLAMQPGTSVSAETVIAHCKAELAYFKVPAAVTFMPELPKGPTGKILRRSLSAADSSDIG